MLKQNELEGHRGEPDNISRESGDCPHAQGCPQGPTLRIVASENGARAKLEDFVGRSL